MVLERSVLGRGYHPYLGNRYTLGRHFRFIVNGNRKKLVERPLYKRYDQSTIVVTIPCYHQAILIYSTHLAGHQIEPSSWIVPKC